MRRWIIFCYCIFSFCMLICMSQTKVGAAGVQSREYSNLVLFVQFSDTTGNFMSNEKDVENVMKYYQDTTFSKSLVSYVWQVSNHKMEIASYLPQYNETNKTIQPLILDQPRDHYASQNDDYTVIKAAIDKLKSDGVDLSVYDLDQNGDGIVDNVTLICEGDEGARASVFYSHKSDYNGADTLNGAKVGTINILNSEKVLNGMVDRYGVISHEFLHSLGYPDLYPEKANYPVYTWDLMAASSNFMSYPLTYLRHTVSNWVDCDEITPSDVSKDTKDITLTLEAAEHLAGKRLYVIKSPLSSSEFFAIEYRKKNGDIGSEALDAKIPGSGLIIYRINTKVDRLSNHYGIPYGVYVFREGETSVNDATWDNLMYKSFFSAESGRTSFGSTDLDAKITDNALVYSDGTNSGIKISDVGSASGDTITCKVSFTDFENVEMWDELGTSASTQNPLSEDSEDISMDVDENGISYMLYSKAEDEFSFRYKLYVSKYEKGKWTQVGPAIDAVNFNVSLRIYQGKIYVLCVDNTYQKMNLYRYESGKWNVVHTVSASDNIEYRTMEASKDGLYIAYANGSYMTGYQLHLDKWNGTNWSVVNDNVATAILSSPSIAIGDSSVYVAYRDEDNKKPVIYRVLNGAVTKMDTKIAGKEIPGDSKVKITAYKDQVFMLIDNNDGLKVYQYMDNSWSQIKDVRRENGALTSNACPSADITIMDGVPIVQVVNQDGDDNNTKVYRYRRGEWVQEGNTIDTGISNSTELVSYKNQAFLAYTSSADGETSYRYPMLKAKTLQVTNDDVPTGGKFKIREEDTMLPQERFTYDGTEKEAKVEIQINGYTLQEGTDYTIQGNKATNRGAYELTVQGIGAYTGTVTKTYQILKDGEPVLIKITDSCVTVLGTKFIFDGAEHSPQINVKVDDKTLIEGNDYIATGQKKKDVGTYTVTIQGAGGYYGSVTRRFTIQAPNVTTPANFTAKVVRYDRVKLTWQTNLAATGYDIYRASSANGSYQKIARISNKYTGSYTNSGLKTGTKYCYKIRAYVAVGGKEFYSSMTGYKQMSPYLNRTSISLRAKKKKMEIRWKRVDGAHGYVIYQATSYRGRYKKIKTVTSGRTTKYTKSRLKSKKKYYYKMKAYRKVGSRKIYASYSKISYKRVK